MSTLCALPGCESLQNPRICGKEGCRALFHHGCAQRLCEDWSGWDNCLKCWLEANGRVAEFAAISAAAAPAPAAPEHEPQSEWLDGNPPEELTDTASLKGAASLSSSLFSGRFVQFTAEEEATFRSRPFFSAVLELDAKRTAPVYNLYRCGREGGERRAARFLSRPGLVLASLLSSQAR